MKINAHIQYHTYTHKHIIYIYNKEKDTHDLQTLIFHS